jgi:hypothetical protein
MVNHQDVEPSYIMVEGKWYHVDSREFETLCEDMYARFEEECMSREVSSSQDPEDDCPF